MPELVEAEGWRPVFSVARFSRLWLRPLSSFFIVLADCLSSPSVRPIVFAVCSWLASCFFVCLVLSLYCLCLLRVFDVGDLVQGVFGERGHSFSSVLIRRLLRSISSV